MVSPHPVHPGSQNKKNDSPSTPLFSAGVDRVRESVPAVA
ncbi:hypothetical protein SGL43_02182 [Streptomyces globisporus]|uniref:Uncharacterized protein n=1 Tax=Streptomyces globisporus TaxID=1908 RepID=A0ABM9GVJ5_STRGL|nr:hypothetical protein SGL43_02182 [Streptomyces globisporus]